MLSVVRNVDYVRYVEGLHPQSPRHFGWQPPARVL